MYIYISALAGPANRQSSELSRRSLLSNSSPHNYIYIYIYVAMIVCMRRRHEYLYIYIYIYTYNI